MDRTSPRALLLLWFSALATAQEPVRPSPSPAAPPLEIARQFACVDDRGPEVLAVGRGWRAAFTTGAVEFRPALGNAVARAWPLRLELASISRGDVVTDAAALPAERRVDRTARTVDFVRPGVVERYRAQTFGLEQSFTFAAPPRGEGDLVVALQVATDLPAGAAAPNRLEWRQAGAGGVSLQKVVGIDARGQRADGSLRRHGAMVELVLPGWFVDKAAYPLVLDPLLGPVSDALASYDIDFPDAAYEPFSDSYCLVWTMYGGGGTSDAVGAVYLASNRQLAYAFVINQQGDEDSLRVASIAGMGVYVFAWCNFAAGPNGPVRISTMTLEPMQAIGSAVYTIAGPGTVDSPQLSSEATLLDDDCLVVWDDAQAGVVGASLTVFPDLTMGMTQPIVIGGGSAATEIAISKQGGDPGLHVVTWVDRPPGLPGWVRAQVVDHDMTIVGPGAWLQNVPQDAGRPAVDGDGFLFFATWQQQEVANPAAYDVHGRTFTVGGAGITSTGPVLPVAVYPNFVDGAPDVALLGDKFGVVYQSGIQNQFVDDVFFRVFERNGVPCGAELHLDVATASHYVFEHAPRIVSRRDGDSSTAADDGLVVFADQHDQTAESDIGLQAVEAMGAGGPVVDLGGGCGPAGLCSVRGPCALGNSTFAIDLHGAPTLAVPYVNIGFASRPPVTCGVCTATDPYFFLFSPNTAGTSTYILPLPGDPVFAGLVLELQWVALHVAYVGCPILPGAAASNRVHATIGY